ncbi:MAG: MFS transporter, partial [Longimicrobiales bacterium]
MGDGQLTLKRRVLAAYAAPAFSQALIHGPTGAVIQGVYAKQFGLSLQSIALVLFVASIFDAAFNPLIGYSSDRYRVRFGSRKPWLIAGSLIAVVACWFLYAPTPPVTTAYFLFWLLLAYAGWAVSEVPYGAWIAEISTDYNERTRLTTWRAVSTYLGAMAFFAIPFLPFFTSTEFTAESLRWTAILAAIALPTFAVIAVMIVPNGAASAPRRTENSQNAWRGILGNRPLLVFALMFALIGLASGVSYGVLFFYVDAYLRQGHALAGLFLLTLPVGALA